MTSRSWAIALAGWFVACGGGAREQAASAGGGSGGTTAAGAGSQNEPAGRSAGGALGNQGGAPDSGAGNAGEATALGGAEPIGPAGASGDAGADNARGGQSASGGGGFGGTAALSGSAGSRAPLKFCGNTDTRNVVDPEGLRFSSHWDQITPENAGKWGSVQMNVNGEFRWAVLDATYEYAQSKSVIFKESSFVWGAGQPGGGATAVHVENWIRSFCQRYPNTKLIDVVQEPTPHTTPYYAQSLGSGETGAFPWIVKAFKLSRKYCPEAVLILNDFNNLEYASEQDHFIQIVNAIKEAGAPIDAIGAEAHGLKGMSRATLASSLERLASLTALPVYITEYDIGDSSDDVQLANFQAHFPVFWQSTAVSGITVWGWIAGATWVSNSGLVKGTTPRPAMNWLMTELGRPALAP